MIKTERFAQVDIDSPEALWDWLHTHHTQTDSIWLVTFKAHVPDKYVSRDEILDAVIAHGWIDGIRRKVDDDRTMQLISPRKQQAWAASYKDRAARLEAEGRMHPAGTAEIARSKAAGLWDYFNDVDALIEPEDLSTVLTGPARAYWDGTGDSYKRNVLRWIKLAKTEPTRRKRVAQVAAASRAKERIPQM